MHYCGIIIHHKDVSLVEARTVLGDILVAEGKADWYSKDDYRERVFVDGIRTVSFKDFEKEYLNAFVRVDNPLALIYVGEDGESDGGSYGIIPQEFWSIYKREDTTYFDELNALYGKAYVDYIETRMSLFFEKNDKDDYVVSLLDYHN